MIKSAEEVSLQITDVKVDNKKSACKSRIILDTDYCVVCGEIVPEGTQVCSGCWKEHFGDK